MWAQAVNRLQTYHNNVNSVLDFYRDILVEVRGCCRAAVLLHACVVHNTGPQVLFRACTPQVDGTRDMDSVFVDIEAALDSIPAPQQAATV